MLHNFSKQLLPDGYSGLLPMSKPTTGQYQAFHHNVTLLEASLINDFAVRLLHQVIQHTERFLLTESFHFLAVFQSYKLVGSVPMRLGAPG